MGEAAASAVTEERVREAAIVTEVREWWISSRESSSRGISNRESRRVSSSGSSRGSIRGSGNTGSSNSGRVIKGTQQME